MNTALKGMKYLGTNSFVVITLFLNLEEFPPNTRIYVRNYNSW